MDELIGKYGPLSSTARVLHPEGNFQHLLDRIDAPSHTVVALDFDQTITLSIKTTSGPKKVSIRGGDESRKALQAMKDSGVSLCIVTAQHPTGGVLVSLRGQLVHLGLDRIFGVEDFDASDVLRVLDSWGADSSMSLQRLATKLLVLLVLHTERFPEDVARIQASSVTFAEDGSSVQYRLVGAAEHMLSAPQTLLASKLALEQDKAAAAAAAAAAQAAAAAAAAASAGAADAKAASPVESKTPTAGGAASPGGSSGTGTGSGPQQPAAPARSRARCSLDSHAVQVELGMCAVATWRVYQSRTAALRGSEVKAHDRLLLGYTGSGSADGEAALADSKSWEPLPPRQLSALAHEVFAAAKVSALRTRFVLVDPNVKLDIGGGVKVARLGNIIACQYNKPEALEYFLRDTAGHARHAYFVDDNSDNAFNVFMHFAQRELSHRDAVEEKRNASLTAAGVAAAASAAATAAAASSDAKREAAPAAGGSESKSGDASASAGGSSVGEPVALHSFWFTPPLGYPHEHFDTGCREMLLALDAHASQREQQRTGKAGGSAGDAAKATGESRQAEAAAGAKS